MLARSTGDPYYDLVAAVFKCALEDLHQKGCITDELPYRYRFGEDHRRLSYQERAKIESDANQRWASEWLDSKDFEWWASLSGLEPTSLREAMINGSPNI